MQRHFTQNVPIFPPNQYKFKTGGSLEVSTFTTVYCYYYYSRNGNLRYLPLLQFTVTTITVGMVTTVTTIPLLQFTVTTITVGMVT